MSLKTSIKNKTPNWLVNFYRWKVAFIAGLLYGFPARKLRVIGITGTNGKTTTCHMLTSVLEAAGHKVGMVTTIDFKIDGKLIENSKKMTSVPPFLLQKLLKQMVQNGCEFAVVEVTSIGLDQHRLWGIPFEAVALTNLTHDHFDYHGTMEEYRAAKEKLFAHRPALSVVNLDDPSAEHFLRYTANRTITYGINERADVTAKKVFERSSGVDFVMLVGTRQATVNLQLPGKFNVYNALTAASIAIGLGIDFEQIVTGLHSVTTVAGRMEVIDEGQAFTVIVDYAHTPDALQKVYETIKPTVRGKLISVLGAAGDRDKTKRPILGALAGRFADYVIITNEDPYSEDPLTIINEVVAGVPRGRPNKGGRYKVNRESDVPFKYKENGKDLWWWIVPERRDAIAKALELARPQDVVLVTGKGAEKVMVVGSHHLPWNDREVIEELLKTYKV